MFFNSYKFIQEWDESLAEQVQIWIEKCDYRHDPDRSKGNNFQVLFLSQVNSILRTAK